MAEKRHCQRWNKETSCTEVWFDRNPDNLPEFQLSSMSSNVFASCSGPDCGLAFVSNLEAASTIKDHSRGMKDKSLIAGCSKWNVRNRRAYGISMSLYDQHPINGKITGDPIADCFGLCARENSALIVAADGVNWGEKPRLAARCAVYGAIKHINERLFKDDRTPHEDNKNIEQDEDPETNLLCGGGGELDGTNNGVDGFGADFCGEEEIKTTKDVFKMLLSSFKEAHKTILKHDGGLTTLCACLVCPISNPPDDDIFPQTPTKLNSSYSEQETSSSSKKFAACVVNVGDSLAFVFGRRCGVREITTGSHDVTLERNIRDAGGALGPVGDGGEPELNNLTCSITCVEAGDVVFLATDGITDNFDPVVTKIAIAKKLDDPETPSKANVKTPTDSTTIEIVQLDIKNSISDNLKSESFQIAEAVDKLKEQSEESPVSSDENSKSDAFLDTKLDKDGVTGVNALKLKDTSIGGNNENLLDMNIVKINSSEILPNISNHCADGESSNEQSSATLNEGCTVSNKICDQLTESDGQSPNVNKQSTSAIKKDEYEDSDCTGNGSKKEDVLGLKDGKPVMLPYERHRYAIKEMERVIHEFELFTECPCSAQELCGALLQHVLKLTDPRRKVLENPDLYGKKKRLKAEERQNRDSQIVFKLAQSPGKLDHATVIGYEVGCFHGNEDEDYS